MSIVLLEGNKIFVGAVVLRFPWAKKHCTWVWVVLTTVILVH